MKLFYNGDKNIIGYSIVIEVQSKVLKITNLPSDEESFVPYPEDEQEIFTICVGFFLIVTSILRGVGVECFTKFVVRLRGNRK